MSIKTTVLGLVFISISIVLYTWTRGWSPPLHRLFPEAAQDVTEAVPPFSDDDLGDCQDMDQLLASLQNKSQREIELAQRGRLMAKIEQLAAEDAPESALSEALYGPQWKVKVDRYRRLILQRELIMIASCVLGLSGIAMSTLAGAYGVTRAIYTRICASVNSRGEKRQHESAEIASDSGLSVGPEACSEPSPSESCKPLQASAELDTSLRRSDSAVASAAGALSYRRDDYATSSLGNCEGSGAAGVFDLFLTDEESVLACQSMECPESFRPEKTVETTFKSELSPSIETQAEDVARQITHVQKLAAENELQTSCTADPFNETLQQLNDQISSIRQYASSQQNRIEKLQSGYDWNIIRTFCLRIIRCIDNLDDRIEKLSGDSGANEMLSDIRDELLFALESSGVERFELETGSHFGGQERLAEAVKEREESDDPESKGRIAQVVKSGYQYILDDENTRIVRTARVKLYG